MKRVKNKTFITVIVLVLAALLVVGIIAGLTKGFRDWSFGKTTTDDGVLTRVATFDFGEKQTVGPEQQEVGVHNDGTIVKDKMELENEEYGLTIATFEHVFSGAYDKVGNSALKLGTTSEAGSVTMHVSKGATIVKIYVAGYKSETAKISINGGEEITVDTLSDNGEYTAIEVKVPSDCEIVLTTLEGGFRAMIDRVEYYA